MVSKRLCSYIALFLDYCSIPMVNICCFSQSDWNNIFRMTHCCSNNLISIIKSITPFNARVLAHCDSWEDFPSIWEYIYSLSDRVSFNDVVEVGEIVFHWHECRLRQTRVVVVVVSDMPGLMWLCFMGVEKYCASSSLLSSVSTWLVVVRCNMGDVWLWAIKVALKSSVLSKCNDNAERGGTKI